MRAKRRPKQPDPVYLPSQGRLHQRKISPRPALATIQFADESIAALFYHARQHTLEDFLQTSDSIDFWFQFILPASYSVHAIRHALCALGGAHQFFLGSRVGVSHSSSIVHIEEAAIQNYNCAIAYIHPLMKQSSEDTLQIVLACCIIFICIENLLGRPAESIRHLNAGRRILTSLYHRQQNTAPEQPWTKRTLQQSNNIIRSISDILLSLRQSAAVYNAATVFPYWNHHQAVDLGDPTVPFDSLSKAIQLSNDIGYACTGFPNSFNRKIIHNTELFDGGDILPSSMGFDWNNEGAAFPTARSAYKAWNSKFEPLRKRKLKEQLSVAARYQLAKLSLTQAVWAALIKIDTFEDDFEKDDCEFILERAEELIRLDIARKIPIFVLDGDLVSALAAVLKSCDDTAIQRKAISMLRSLHRRDGLWDSQELADIFEASIDARNSGAISWDTQPLAIPELRKRLRCLRFLSR
ncbi:C6 zinc finger domain-containing protein [Fusarium pseudocircinatum]|uniref:C6 zinc finger domain-containing protein n=1 Tax=Fusarium pseudocircinatum TaxID=56676 RepID=A0A8H5KKU2_9HYPO|nr:C6 zinc finger domain-containing protein [Fusarium pseudocircinatum]